MRTFVPVQSNVATLVLALLLGLNSGCSKDPTSASGADSTGSPATEAVDYSELDLIAEQDIRENASEARIWLAGENNVLFEGSKAEVLALTENFYQAGCPKVFITGIERLAEFNVSASIVVVLPTDPARRNEAFKVEQTFMQAMGEDGAKDMGQKYLMIGFD